MALGFVDNDIHVVEIHYDIHNTQT